MIIRPAGLALALLLALPGLPVVSSTVETTTYYLHGTAPVLLADSVGAIPGATPDGWMDATAPTGAAPKVATMGVIGNSAVRANTFQPYWDGALHATIKNVHARVWVSAPADSSLALLHTAPVVAVLFDDAGVVARANVSVPVGGISVVDVSFGDATANVAASFELAFYSAYSPAQVWYDSASMPSSITFDAGDYVAPPPPLPPGTATPAPGWGAVQLAGVTELGREASLAINPHDNRMIAMCAPTGVPDTSRGHSFFAGTLDAGATWAELEVEQSRTDLRSLAFEGGDCDVAFDQGGTMYSADTWLGDLSVGHSSDGGKTWTGTPLAVTGPIVDRPWLVGGPAGMVHLSYQDVQFGMPTVIWYTRSIDSGVTWLPAVPIVTSTPGAIASWEGNLAVAPNQRDLYLVYTTRADPQYITGGAENVRVAASHDGGATWKQLQVSARSAKASYLYPSISIDKAGGLHAVWAEKTSTDQPVWYTYSADQGQTWTTPVKVNPGKGSVAPWVAGGNAGEAAIAWLGVEGPAPDASKQLDWFVYAVRVSGASAGAPTFVGGATTTTPVYHGAQTMPEFNEVRYDKAGKIHVGFAAFLPDGNGGVNWGLFHQAQV